VPGTTVKRAVCISGTWVLLQGARFGNWFAVVAAGGGCEMPMAVWALGPVGDHVYAVAQKASAWLLPKKYFAVWGLCRRSFIEKSAQLLHSHETMQRTHLKSTGTDSRS
jgi:hypothetical protein